MKTLTKKEMVENLKKEIREAGYPSHEAVTGYSNQPIGTMYIKETMDYGFHIFFIHEPDENNPLAGVDGIVSEMFYDLRNRVYWIKRNMKEVNFSARNVDSIFPFEDGVREVIFNKLSTTANQGLYFEAFKFLSKMGREQSQMYGRFFHRLITEHSYYELLYKAKIPVTRILKIVNRQGTSPREILGLTKTQWKMYTKYDIPLDTVRKRINDEADKKAINYLAYIKTLEDEYGLDKINKFSNKEFGYLYGEHSYRSALKIAKRYNLPEKIFIRYIYFECDVSQGLDPNMAISQYEDYIRMTTEMGYERFERYPKYLRTAHDIASRNYKVKLNDMELQQWNEQLEDNNKFRLTIGDYKVFPPEKPEDLVREGNVLGHCVGSYVNKVRKGISTILFLRDRDDIEAPLVTVEVRGGKIIQARGKMNYPPTEKQKEALRKFANKFALAI